MVSGARLYSSSAASPPSFFPLCHSFERNDVRSGLFIVVKNTSKCPSSPARDKGQPPLLFSPLRFTLVPVAMYRCYSHESLVSWTVFPPSIPWFPLSELCSDRRSEFPHSPTLTLGNGASASPREQGTERRDDATGRKNISKGGKGDGTISFLLISPPYHFLRREKYTLQFLLSYSVRRIVSYLFFKLRRELNCINREISLNFL